MRAHEIFSKQHSSTAPHATLLFVRGWDLHSTLSALTLLPNGSMRLPRERVWLEPWTRAAIRRATMPSMDRYPCRERRGWWKTLSSLTRGMPPLFNAYRFPNVSTGRSMGFFVQMMINSWSVSPRAFSTQWNSDAGNGWFSSLSEK